MTSGDVARCLAARQLTEQPGRPAADDGIPILCAHGDEAHRVQADRRERLEDRATLARLERSIRAQRFFIRADWSGERGEQGTEGALAVVHDGLEGDLVAGDQVLYQVVGIRLVDDHLGQVDVRRVVARRGDRRRD